MKRDGPPDALPAAYAPFAPMLARLSEPLRRLLEGQLAQFERIAHVLHAQEMARSGVFEGLGGLTHRGEITHILQSELLLRSEAPLEFLRRIAEGEALFLEKQYADPGARWLYRATVSVGPGLLGHGRIVALAAIFFLARIARERGAAFHWCFLPRADGAVWFDEVSVNTVKRFLRAASFREMTADDRTAADATWEEIVPEALRGHRRFDWTIGFDAPGRVAAASAADNVLAFALSPPLAGEPRTAELVLRRNGREGARATIRFAEDRLCVEALRNPFEQVRALPAPARLGDAIPPQEGWEPQYLALANMHARLVRLDDGLLVLGQATKSGFRESYFVVLDADTQLVGVRIADMALSLLVHQVRGGRETLSYTQHRIEPGKPPQHLLTRARAVPSRHLFQKRSRFVIPPLNRHDGAEFYSASGQAYRLGFYWKDEDVTFAPLYQSNLTLHATAQYRVLLAQQHGTPMLRVVKHRRTDLDQYVLPSDVVPERFQNIVYSVGDRSLAYSLAPGEWILPSVQGRQGARMLPVAPHEMPLMAKVTEEDQTVARLWSDARYGGDGIVRWVRHDGGRNVQTSAPLDLGTDALAMARLVLAEDGLWGVTLDSAGLPAHLLRYRRMKREQRFAVQRYDLAELAAGAARIQLEGGDAPA